MSTGPLLRLLIVALGLMLFAPESAAQLDPRACPRERPPSQELEANEGRPPLGHTIARHVQRSDADLRRRLELERSISAASTFPDLVTAQCVVDRTLSTPQNRRRIARWLEDPDRRTLALFYRGTVVIGRILGRNGIVQEATSATIVLRKVEGRAFVILTAYPDF